MRTALIAAMLSCVFAVNTGTAVPVQLDSEILHSLINSTGETVFFRPITVRYRDGVLLVQAERDAKLPPDVKLPPRLGWSIFGDDTVRIHKEGRVIASAKWPDFGGKIEKEPKLAFAKLGLRPGEVVIVERLRSWGVTEGVGSKFEYPVPAVKKPEPAK